MSKFRRTYGQNTGTGPNALQRVAAGILHGQNDEVNAVVALELFCDEQPERSTAWASATAGTDNRANQYLSEKMMTTKVPLMLVPMQPAVSMGKRNLKLELAWRPREENKLADALTNGDYTGCSMMSRIDTRWEDL